MTGEVVALKAAVQVTEEVESWLQQLVEATRNTLQHLLSDCVNSRDVSDLADIPRYPSQILCLAEAVAFTAQCEKAMASDGLSALKSHYQNQLATYTRDPANSTQETRVVFLKRQALIMDIIHYIDVVDQLVAAHCTSTTDWIWLKQLRFVFVDWFLIELI